MRRLGPVAPAAAAITNARFDEKNRNHTCQTDNTPALERLHALLMKIQMGFLRALPVTPENETVVLPDPNVLHEIQADDGDALVLDDINEQENFDDGVHDIQRIITQLQQYDDPQDPQLFGDTLLFGFIDEIKIKVSFDKEDGHWWCTLYHVKSDHGIQTHTHLILTKCER